MKVRNAQPADHAAWLRMRCELWPEGSMAEHAFEIDEFFAGRSLEPIEVLIAESGGDVLGFIELSIRPFAEGCVTRKVGYIEGWFVVPAARKRGVGKALVRAAEDWARSQGCTEFASDTEADNTNSIRAHVAIGFETAGLIQSFRKDL